MTGWYPEVWTISHGQCLNMCHSNHSVSRLNAPFHVPTQLILKIKHETPDNIKTTSKDLQPRQHHAKSASTERASVEALWSSQSKCVASERPFHDFMKPSLNIKHETPNNVNHKKPGNLRSLEPKAKRKEENRARQTFYLRSLDRKRKETPQHNDRQRSDVKTSFPNSAQVFESTRIAHVTLGLHPRRPLKPWMSTTPSMRTAPHFHGHILQSFSSYMLDTLNQNHQKSLDLNMKPRNICLAWRNIHWGANTSSKFYVRSWWSTSQYGSRPPCPPGQGWQPWPPNPFHLRLHPHDHPSHPQEGLKLGRHLQVNVSRPNRKALYASSWCGWDSPQPSQLHRKASE